MKISLKALIYPVLLICLCTTAKAQLNVPDSVRIGIGADIASTVGVDFGTGVNTTPGGTGSSAYSYGAGVNLRVDVPVLFSQLYVTGSAGYTTFFTNGNASSSQQALTNTKLPNFETIPLKIGLKYLVGNRFYFQGEVGETLLANKAALYAVYNRSFTWSPQIGLVLPLKKNHTYIDTGIRFENMEGFYNTDNHNEFWAFHIAYTFNL